jgi:hypothetical protein
MRPAHLLMLTDVTGAQVERDARAIEERLLNGEDRITYRSPGGYTVRVSAPSWRQPINHLRLARARRKRRRR